MIETRNIIFFKTSLWLIFYCTFSTVALADDRDEEFFGKSAQGKKTQKNSNAVELESLKKDLEKQSQVKAGGRIELEQGAIHSDNTPYKDSLMIQKAKIEVYGDVQANQNLRGFVRAKYYDSQDSQSAKTSQQQTVNSNNSSRLVIDESWFKWDENKLWFFTYGKQHLKWGSARFWNPTDFMANQAKDPFSEIDDRLGVHLLKIHKPLEHRNHNYYALLQFENSKTIDDIGAALRAEMLSETRELSVTLAMRKNQPLRLGVDLNWGLSFFDLHFENAFLKNDPRKYYKGSIDPANKKFPTPFSRKKEWLLQSTTGIDYSHRYNDDDALTLGLEYFFNETGYDQYELEILALMQKQNELFYLGRHYFGSYVRLPKPLDFENTIQATLMRNISDKSTMLRLHSQWAMLTHANFELYYQQCIGNVGELCLAKTTKIKKLESLSPSPTSQIPSEPFRHQMGAKITLSF